MLEQLSWKELDCARAAFILRNEVGRLVGMLVLHVDDALIFGDRSDSYYMRARRGLDRVFDIKEWKQLGAVAQAY